MVDEIGNDIDFTITESQLTEGNDTNVNRDTEPSVDFTVMNRDNKSASWNDKHNLEV